MSFLINFAKIQKLHFQGTFDENDHNDLQVLTTMFCFVANIPFILTTLATRPYLEEEKKTYLRMRMKTIRITTMRMTMMKIRMRMRMTMKTMRIGMTMMTTRMKMRMTMTVAYKWIALKNMNMEQTLTE